MRNKKILSLLLAVLFVFNSTIIAFANEKDETDLYSNLENQNIVEEGVGRSGNTNFTRTGEIVKAMFLIDPEVSNDKFKISMSFREKGTSSWYDLPVGTYDVDGVNTLGFSFEIEKGKEYEYCIYYYKGFNPTYLFKVAGVIDSNGEITNTPEEKNVTSDVTDEGVIFTLQSDPVTNKFKCNSFISIYSKGVKNSHLQLVIRDSEGVKIPVNYYSYVEFNIPTEGTLPKNFTYELEFSGYKTAKGNLLVKSEDDVILENIENHKAEIGPNGSAFKLDLTLEAEDSEEGNYIFQSTIENIIEGTNVKIESENKKSKAGFGKSDAPLKDSGTTFKSDSGTNFFKADLQGESEDILTLTFEKEGFADVVLKVKVKDDRTWEIVNVDEAKENSWEFNYEIDNNRILLKQLVELKLVETGEGKAVAKTNAFDDIIFDIRPGVTRDIPFRITNDTDKKYYFKNVKFKEKFANLEVGMYRANSDVIRKYYDEFNPTYPHEKGGDASYIFNFKDINGKDLYDGLLELYQLDNPSLKRLEDLPAKELVDIFCLDWQFDAKNWRGDPYADYAAIIGDGKYYAIKELDKKMINLGIYHFYYNSMYFTFDNLAYPISATSSKNKDELSFVSYLDNENKEIAKDVLKDIMVFDSKKSVDFKNANFVAVGDYIHNPYRPSFSILGFEFVFEFSDTEPEESIEPTEPTNPTKPSEPSKPEKPTGSIKEITLVGGPKTLTGNVENQLMDFVQYRLWGADRYGTSADVAKEYKQSNIVLLASGEKYTDELTATVLANKLNAPIMLTRKDKVPAEVKTEINRLGATKVILIGGGDSISEKVEKELSNYTIERIGGPDRYDTAILVGNQVRSLTGSKTDGVLVDGTNFPDAIAMTSMGVEQNMPILLTKPRELPASTAKTIKDWKLNKVTIGGGVNSISATVANEVKKFAIIDRIAGSDRYETSVLVAEQVYVKPVHAVIASGEVFPDAIVGAPYAAKNGYPIVLSRGNNVPEVVMDYVLGNR